MVPPLILLACLALPGVDPLPPELQPPRVSLQKDTPLSQALRDLESSTGNTIEDARSTAKDPVLKLDLKDTTFWPALEAICLQTGCGFSLYKGRWPTLIDRPLPKVPTCHSGLFRISLKRLALVQHLEDDTHTCHLDLNVAWEPRLRPYYLDVGPLTAVFADADKKTHTSPVDGAGKQDIHLSLATEINVLLPAPPRSARHLQSLAGWFNVVTATRMLTFTFDKLKPSEKEAVQEKDGVQVTLKSVKVGPDRWSFLVQIDNPPGTPAFESFESWLGNNTIRLERDKDTWMPEAEEVVSETPRRALVWYHFTDRKRIAAGKVDDWTLTYTTPHRIVSVPVTFQLRDVALP